MLLSHLKEQILNNTLPDDFLIFKYQDNTFLIDQYIDNICNQKGLIKHKIESIFEINSSAADFVMNTASNLNVLYTDEFDEYMDIYPDNTIIVCKKISDKLDGALDEQSIVEFIKLQDWHIIYYCLAECPGLDKEDCAWLCQAAGSDIYKISNVLDKIKLFDQKQHRNVLMALRYEPNTELYNATVYEFVDALINKDIRKLTDILEHIDNCDIEGLGVVKLLLNKFKLILLANKQSNLTANDLGISQKYFNALGYYYKHCTPEYLKPRIEFLADINIRLAQGRLELDKKQLLTYLIYKILG